ncbi:MULTISPECIES: ABC transporter permease [Gordonia]|uniref:YrbE family protein n=2 Tax=Gordonia TaxID=2053 RepID=A0ABQ0IF73_9ACTN|nr:MULTISPECIES: ABC transporter permease [Gordonia]OCW87379.1 ABC transporter permease [Nocardia farcinica]MBY4572058.1 ABC transporter permease [Gordonia paraffinivorans]MDF6101902.1 ABC transporter permease [Gordonia hongkongensis]PWD43899.1 ABC transporter permease [Gordonia paraffinivorans]WGJ84082.1 ABC transporter permease [Gordonia sp. SMJS1]
MTASRYVPPVLKPVEAAAKVVYHAPRNGLAAMGHLITFLVRSIGAVPLAFRQYSSEVWRLLSDVAWGNGAIVVGGGTVGVMVILGVMGGATVGIEGYTALNLLGMSPVTGGLSAFATTREIAPLLAATAFTAQSGCRFTAQLGSMRIAEEIDALEAIAIRPLPYLVTTRMCAAVLAIIPLYSVSLAANYLACEVMFMLQSGQGAGTYLYYFHSFILSWDMVFSFIKVIVFVLLTTFIQCYYGYFAAGGPEGVGVAAGHAIRLAIIVIVFANLIMTLVFWGTSPGIQISG